MFDGRQVNPGGVESARQGMIASLNLSVSFRTGLGFAGSLVAASFPTCLELTNILCDLSITLFSPEGLEVTCHFYLS